MKIVRSVVLMVAPSLIFLVNAQALTILNVGLDLESDGRVISFSNQDSWEGRVAIDPISFATGDSLLVKIRF